MNSTILRLVAGRIVAGLGSLLAVSAVVFAITGVLPGDAAQEKLGQEATPETLAALRKEMGLDRSAAVVGAVGSTYSTSGGLDPLRLAR